MDDVATRFEVPIRQRDHTIDHGSENENGDSGMTLAQLFHILATQGDFSEYTVERATLESVFLKVIRQNNVLEEDSEHQRRRHRFW